VPQTLAAGSTLTIAASTEDYSIEKEITIPAGGLKLSAGKITTLKINLEASHITASSGASLPFIDNMAWANSGATDGTSDIGSSIASEANSNGLYSAGTKVYKGIGGRVKLGTGSASGSFTTKELNLSGAFNIAIKGGKYGSDTGTLEVSVDETKVITGVEIEGIHFVNIPAGTYTTKSKVTIATSAKRGYIYSVKIQSGEYVPDPVINVTSSNPMAVSNANDLHAIEYSISNPTGASLSAVANVAWIHVFDYSTPGEVCFEVDAQATDADARSGIITLSYSGAEDVTVTVNQAAGPSSGGSYSWVETPLASITSSDVFVIVGNNGSNYAMSNGNGTGSAPSAVAVTVTGTKITSDVADNIKWNLTVSTGNYTFYPNGDSEKWLYCTNTNNGVRVGINDNKVFTITDNYLKNTGTSRYVGIYNSADWRCYTSINANIEGQTFKFYVYKLDE
jgi:hypothetical protein